MTMDPKALEAAANPELDRRLPVGTGPSSVPDRAAEGVEPNAGAIDFVARYMRGSGIPVYVIDGDKVIFEGITRYVLPCACGEDSCEGWAMVYPGNRHFHLFQNGLTSLSYNEAMALDLAEAQS